MKELNAWKIEILDITNISCYNLFIFYKNIVKFKKIVYI